jgi:hypothetical protein
MLFTIVTRIHIELPLADFSSIGLPSRKTTNNRVSKNRGGVLFYTKVLFETDLYRQLEPLRDFLDDDGQT